MARLEAEVDLSRGCAAEALVWPQERVVAKSKFQAQFELALNEGRKDLDDKSLLERPPQALEESDRAYLPDGPESMADAKLVQNVTKHCGGELASLVGDEVAGKLRRSWTTSHPVGSFEKTLAAIGSREKTSRMRASLKEKSPKRPEMSVRSTRKM